MQGKITQQFIQTLLATIDVVDIINPRVPLKKNGKDFSGCCPFHTEKTPSFTVSQPKQFYHCFGCGAHGNAVDFLIQHDQMAFPDAIHFLADTCGLTVEYDGKGPNEDHQPIYDILEHANKYYQQALRDTPTAIEYLKKRNLTGQTAKQFMIGYAPDEWQLDHIHPQSSQTQTSTLVVSGILTSPPGKKPYTRFRKRIMFPIRNRRGQIIGFGGRALGDDKPKYLNSPETPLFHKQHELYGLYEAKQANNTLPYIIIVEGYMDVIALYQHGLTTAVATLGTAINENHIQNLTRHTRQLVFCFDGDTAGQKAAWKALQLCLPFLKDGIDVRFLTLENQLDPDDVVHAIGKTAFTQLIDNAPPLSDTMFRILKKQHPLNTISEKTQFANEAIKLINCIPAGIYRSLIQQDLAQQLNMPTASIKSLLSPRIEAHQQPPSQHPRSTHPLTKTITLSKPAYMASALLTHYPEKHQLIDLKYNISHSPIDGADIFMAIVSTLRLHPNTKTAAQVSALFEQSPFLTVIKQLASTDLPFSEQAIDTELAAITKRLNQAYQKSLSDKLIRKAKTEGLSPDEKQQLQALLLKNDQDKLD